MQKQVARQECTKSGQQGARRVSKGTRRGLQDEGSRRQGCFQQSRTFSKRWCSRMVVTISLMIGLFSTYRQAAQ